MKRPGFTAIRLLTRLAKRISPDREMDERSSKKKRGGSRDDERERKAKKQRRKVAVSKKVLAI